MKVYFKYNDLFRELKVVEASNYSQILVKLGFDFCLGYLYSDYENAKCETSCKCDWNNGVYCEECSLEFERYIAVQSIIDSLSYPQANIVVFKQGFNPNEFYSIPSVNIKHLTEEENGNFGDELMSKMIIHTEEFASFFDFLAIEDKKGNTKILKEDGEFCDREELLGA